MSAFGQTVSFGTVTGVADNAALLSTKRLSQSSDQDNPLGPEHQSNASY
jgi:hypothetical protein